MTTIICIVLFLSTLSLRRATSFSLSAPPAHDNFYPRSPCGERQRPSWACRICRNFYPRSPCGERPEPDPCIAGPAAISIHALLAESDLLTSVLISSADWISIHALLAESDFGALCGAAGVADFYPRSPCGERRKATNAAGPNNQISIHALLAESDPHRSYTRRTVFISIHALLAESDLPPCGIPDREGISIHALLAESDFRHNADTKANMQFLSTLSLRRATRANSLPDAPPHISIHALLAESDSVRRGFVA